MTVMVVEVVVEFEMVVKVMEEVVEAVVVSALCLILKARVVTPEGIQP